MDRRHFLQNTCPTITFAFFGLSYIQACSKGDDSVDNQSSVVNNNSGNVSNGVTVSGNIISVDLSNATFSGLSSPGNYINLTANQILILKISDNEYRVFFMYWGGAFPWFWENPVHIWTPALNRTVLDDYWAVGLQISHTSQVIPYLDDMYGER